MTDPMHVSTTSRSCPKVIWTGSSAMKRECTDRSTGQCRDSWSPGNDEKPWNPRPTDYSHQPAKTENEANKWCIFNATCSVGATAQEVPVTTKLGNVAQLMGERDKGKEDEIAKPFESIRGEPAFAGNWRDSRSFKSTMGPPFSEDFGKEGADQGRRSWPS